MADKLRIHQIAKELGISSKAILMKCAAEGVEVKNHMSTVSAGLAATIHEWFSDHKNSSTSSATETAERVDVAKLRKAQSARRRKRKKEDAATEETKEPEEITRAKPAPKKKTRRTAAAKSEPEPAEDTSVAVAEPPETSTVEQEEDIKPAGTTDDQSEEAPPADVPEQKVAEVQKSKEPPAPPQPAGPQNVPEPAKLSGPRVIRVEAPEPVRRPHRAGPPRQREDVAATGTDWVSGTPDSHSSRKGRSKTYQGVDQEEERRKRSAGTRRRNRGSESGDQLKEWRDQDLAERRERLRGATGRRAKRRASEGGGAVVHRVVTQAQVSEPIVLKDFCSNTGLSMAQIAPKLISDHKLLPSLNMVLDKDTAVLVADDFGIELQVIEARSPLDNIREEFRRRERPHLQRRAPVVTFLGHVDHGKTSLLDAIRHSRVTQSEAGGITQHMGSYHLDREGLSVTFLDTPGHQAFTAMRARGAQLTDVVVLVVAADDGVMPQTVEAINHAKAADVPIVVALNKIDLPGVDLNKIYGQLAEHDLAPAEWGGSTDVIKTSATEGSGVDDLVEHLSTLSDLLELTGDPTVPARGRVIESEMKSGVGVVARVLIQDGSLKRGDVLVCGPAFGKVRSLKNDQRNELAVAGPSMPVEIAGLDELPSAGDEMYQVDSLKRAEQVAYQIKQDRRRNSLIRFNKPTSLEDLFSQRETGEVPELNVIIKADAQGSADVLNKALMDIPSDEVKLNILHSGVGGVVESDVLLAEASDAIIIGFQVVADTSVRRIADEKQVDIRHYRVIYNVLDDIKKALEGLLTPDEQLEQRGQAEVRELFKVSKIGTVAGCYVREGTIARTYKARVIRDSVVIRDESDIESLRRFKDDVKEVKSGYECGIKISGFDDVKPGDVIEAYEVVKIARTL